MCDPDLLAAARCGPLEDLPSSVLDEVLGGMVTFSAAAGERIYRPGQLTGMHVVVRGMVRVAMTSVDGSALNTGWLWPADGLW